MVGETQRRYPVADLRAKPGDVGLTSGSVDEEHRKSGAHDHTGKLSHALQLSKSRQGPVHHTQ